MTNKDWVLSRIPDAHCAVNPQYGEWTVFVPSSDLGVGNTEEEAWANAATLIPYPCGNLDEEMKFLARASDAELDHVRNMWSKNKAG